VIPGDELARDESVLVRLEAPVQKATQLRGIQHPSRQSQRASIAVSVATCPRAAGRRIAAARNALAEGGHQAVDSLIGETDLAAD